MSEREIRRVIAEVCAELDRQVRAAVSCGVRRVVLPAALGAGLALTAAACGDDDPGPGSPAYGAPAIEAGVGDAGVDRGPAALYAAVGPEAGAGPTPTPLYAAPE